MNISEDPDVISAGEMFKSRRELQPALFILCSSSALKTFFIIVAIFAVDDGSCFP